MENKLLSYSIFDFNVRFTTDIKYLYLRAEAWQCSIYKIVYLLCKQPSKPVLKVSIFIFVPRSRYTKLLLFGFKNNQQLNSSPKSVKNRGMPKHLACEICYLLLYLVD